jgi:hypothetical protein
MAKKEALAKKAAKAQGDRAKEARKASVAKSKKAIRAALDTSITVSERVYQFKITLKGITPAIWRRIQTRDCTLDTFHELMLAAMGWRISHEYYYQFIIANQSYCDPMLLGCSREEVEYVDATSVTLADSMPTVDKWFTFRFGYDFADEWDHEVFLERILAAEEEVRYPLCVAGERASPPEDMGFRMESTGIWGYQEFVKALINPRHKRHREVRAWCGPFDPEKFDAQTVTTEMQKRFDGLEATDAIASWESAVPRTRAQVEDIDNFDARGMYRVYGRSDHFGQYHTFNMDIWKTSDGRLLMRCWSRCDEIDWRSFEVTGVDLSRIPERKKGGGLEESWIPRAVRDAYEEWLREEW